MLVRFRRQHVDECIHEPLAGNRVDEGLQGSGHSRSSIGARGRSDATATDHAMTQAGADIIVAWPISPTALNRAVRAACQKGVTFITWDAR